jgi:hypothetical protein
MLRNGGKALIQQKLQCVVAHRFDQPNELPLIGGQLGVLRCDGAAVDGNRATILIGHVNETGARRVTVDDEGGIEVRQLEHRAGDQGLLEGVKGLISSRVLGEGLLQQLRERAGDQAVILDEFTVVTHKVKEAS